MAKIDLPKPLKQLLEESDLLAPIRTLADRVGELVADNKLPFFPDYTDHGVDHINSVLKTEVELVPKNVWGNSNSDSDPRLLSDADAAVIVGATLLHDLAMHLRPDGFLELVGVGSRFQPLPWFKESHVDHPGDCPWDELWNEYVREARRFSDRDLANIIGEESAQRWKFEQLPEDIGKWERNHCLIIGEFVRRHHARMAHEIAIYGFPGLPAGSGEAQFPAMGKEEGHPLVRLADLIGLTARSHGTSLRVCKSYLEASPLYPGTPKPMGTAVLYPMALLRVADYFQIDRQRAPAVLLQLRNPPSPISVMEWKKHRAVQNIGPATDPRGKMVTVSTDLSLKVYLQLRDLIAGLQFEMDHSTAVLDEAYGTLTDLGLNQLNLATRRVYSNLHSPAFRDSLPYIPDRTGFTADPNLLTLLVEPLYGRFPGVGVRELMQNAVDAVCELRGWCEAHGKPEDQFGIPELDADVLIEFIKREDSSWFLRVRDKGIGMKSSTIHHYFLRAGASFRRSAEWAKEFLNEKGQPRVERAGRFGIGAFAVFLLGPSFKMSTRHASADSLTGYMFTASSNSQLIEIRRADSLPVGTTIEVELSAESVKALGLESEAFDDYSGPRRRIDWFCWDWPKVIQRVVRGPMPETLKQEFVAPIREGELPPEWSVIHPNGFDAVHWTHGGAPRLSCNGLRIASPQSLIVDTTFDWATDTLGILPPCVAVTDSGANLPLTTQRYQLSQSTLPFIDALSRDVILSVLAHALVCGPSTRSEALRSEHSHPLRVEQVSQFGNNQGSGIKDSDKSPFAYGRLRWCATDSEMVLSDPWLYALLDSELCFVFGSLEIGDYRSPDKLEAAISAAERLVPTGASLLHWRGVMRYHGSSRADVVRQAASVPVRVLGILTTEGVAALGHELIASSVLVSATEEMIFAPPPPDKAANIRKHKNVNFKLWDKVQSKSDRRSLFRSDKGAVTKTSLLHGIFEAVEAVLPNEDEIQRNRGSGRNPEVIFVAELKTKKKKGSPDSLIARIWDECLGARAIPFDREERKKLIADGLRHSELKRHIEAWEKLKRKSAKRLKVADE